MGADRDLEIILAQERSLVFAALTEADAFAIGCDIRDMGLARGYPLVIDILLSDRRLFFAGLPGSSISLGDWVRRKINTVKIFHKSTYRIVVERPRPDRVFETMHNLPASDYVVAGGAFPINIKGAGVVGAIGVAGAHERDDHGMIVEAICRHLAIEPALHALPPLQS